MTCPNCERLKARLEKANGLLRVLDLMLETELDPLVRSTEAAESYYHAVFESMLRRTRAYFTELSPNVPTIPDPKLEGEL